MPNHPQGVNYIVFVQQLATNATTTIAVYNTIVNSSTSFTVHSKTNASVALASNFSYIQSHKLIK